MNEPSAKASNTNDPGTEKLSAKTIEAILTNPEDIIYRLGKDLGGRCCDAALYACRGRHAEFDAATLEKWEMTPAAFYAYGKDVPEDLLKAIFIEHRSFYSEEFKAAIWAAEQRRAQIGKSLPFEWLHPIITRVTNSYFYDNVEHAARIYEGCTLPPDFEEKAEQHYLYRQFQIRAGAWGQFPEERLWDYVLGKFNDHQQVEANIAAEVLQDSQMLEPAIYEHMDWHDSHPEMCHHPDGVFETCIAKIVEGTPYHRAKILKELIKRPHGGDVARYFTKDDLSLEEIAEWLPRDGYNEAGCHIGRYQVAALHACIGRDDVPKEWLTPDIRRINSGVVRMIAFRCASIPPIRSFEPPELVYIPCIGDRKSYAVARVPKTAGTDYLWHRGGVTTYSTDTAEIVEVHGNVLGEEIAISRQDLKTVFHVGDVVRVSGGFDGPGISICLEEP